MTTALQIIQQATGEMGLVVPQSVAGTQTADNVQLLALLNAVGSELRSQHTWQRLQKEYRFFTTYYTAANVHTVAGSPILTTAEGISLGQTVPDDNCLEIEGIEQQIEVETATDFTFLDLDNTFAIIGAGVNKDTEVLNVLSATQLTMNAPARLTGYATIYFCKVKYSYPDDYDRPIDRTQWDITRHWEMMGPCTPQQWQFLKSGFIATGPRIRFRNMGNKFEIWPALTSAENLGYEYFSKSWVTGADGTTKEAITADTDTVMFPDRLLVLGLKVKYFDIKGFDSGPFRRDYEIQFNNAKANDAGSRILSFAPQINSTLIGWNQIPDSGYGA